MQGEVAKPAQQSGQSDTGLEEVKWATTQKKSSDFTFCTFF